MSTMIITNYFKNKLTQSDINFTSDTFKIALIGAYATFSDSSLQSISAWSYLSGNEITGDGYTTGGITLLGAEIVYNQTNSYVKFNSVSWNITGTITTYGAAVYRVSDGLVLGIIKFNSDLSPSVCTVGVFQIVFSSNGLIVVQ